MTASATIQANIAGHYIHGQWITESPDGLGDSLNPATGQVLGRYVLGNERLAQQAVAAARECFANSTWSVDMRLRSRVLLEMADRLQAQRETLIELICAENGKVHHSAMVEVDQAISECRYYAGLARNLFGRMIEMGPDQTSLLPREPIGVAAVIVPWNAPVTLLFRSLAPALAAGCTTVIKPAPQTPLVNTQVIACITTCKDLPAGVINSVNENGTRVGEALVASTEVDVISFTGSRATGKKIMAAAAKTLKRVSLELGGKSPAVIFPDADLDKVVQQLVPASLSISGQMCVSVSRLLVHEDRYQELRSRFATAYEAYRVGPAADHNSQMGPMIDQAGQQRILQWIDRAATEGEIIVRGKTLTGEHSRGFFITPTLFRIDDVQSELVQEELFGPMVSLETFASEAEALAKANATRYGLAAAVYTRDLNIAQRVSRGLKFGTVWINSYMKLFPEIETGGYRESGLGRLHGVEALNDFLETKHIYIDASH